MAPDLRSQEKDVINPDRLMTFSRKSVRTVTLLILFLFLTVVSIAQDLSKKITIIVKDQPISEVLKLIARQGNIDFSYSPQVIPAGKYVTIEARHKTIRQVLDELLRLNGIDYFVVENQVILRPLNPLLASDQKINNTPLRNYTLSGFLREKSSGEVLIGATVHLQGTTLGTCTNGYGFYSITIPEGRYQISFSYLGYREQVETVDLHANAILEADLEEVSLEAGEVEIVASSPESDLRNNQLSEFSFSQKTLAKLPGFAGNLDVIRALQAVPGIQTFGDGSSLYYVRGGNSDQNLMLIDEVPVYNPSHLFGFFSAFSPDAINDVQVYKGDFPSKYGGRLSSVIDIKAKEGNMKRFGISGNIGPYASNISLQGPVFKNRVSFFISGRISTLNWINSDM